MSKPLVSVIVATYRRDSSLRKALNSLAAQTFRDFEIVVIDDNDEKQWNKRILEIINEFKTRNENLSICYIDNHPNLGSAKARNAGIASSHGEFITFLDDDDVYLPKKIEHQYKAMLKSYADYSLTDLGLYNEDDTLSEIRKRDYINTYEGKDLKQCHLKYHMTGTDSMMFRKKYLIDIGGFEPLDVGDEYYLMMKAIEYGGRFKYVPCCDVKAYVHNGDRGLSSGEGKIIGENNLYEYKKRYFSLLSSNSVRYIRMRHFAVLAFAYKRMNRYVEFISCSIVSLLVAPMECLKLFINRKGY